MDIEQVPDYGYQGGKFAESIAEQERIRFFKLLGKYAFREEDEPEITDKEASERLGQIRRILQEEGF